MAQSFSNKIKEFQAALKGMPGTEKNAEAFSRIIASVAASQDILRELGSRGMVSELKEYIDTIEKLMKSVSSIKIPKRPAMRSDSPKKNEQELLKYQRRLEKLNVVLDDYDKKVQKANEKAAMFAHFTKHGYDKSEEIKDSKYTGDDELAEKNRQKLREFNELSRKEAERDFREAAARVKAIEEHKIKAHQAIKQIEEERLLKLKTLNDISKPIADNAADELRYAKEKQTILRSMLNDEVKTLRITKGTEFEKDSNSRIKKLQEQVSIEKELIKQAERKLTVTKEQEKIDKIKDNLRITVSDVKESDGSLRDEIRYKEQMLFVLKKERDANIEIAKITSGKHEKQDLQKDIAEQNERLRVTKEELDVLKAKSLEIDKQAKLNDRNQKLISIKRKNLQLSGVSLSSIRPSDGTAVDGLRFKKEELAVITKMRDVEVQIYALETSGENKRRSEDSIRRYNEEIVSSKRIIENLNQQISKEKERDRAKKKAQDEELKTIENIRKKREAFDDLYGKIGDIKQIGDEEKDKLRYEKDKLTWLQRRLALEVSIKKMTSNPDEKSRQNKEIQKHKSLIDAQKKSIIEQEKLVRLSKNVAENMDKQVKSQESLAYKIISSVRNFMSIEKLVSRITFVLTAKFAYSIMQFFTRLPRQVFQLFTEFEAEMSKTFALISGKSDVTKRQLTNDIITLSKQYGMSAKEISSAFYEIISAQVPIRNAISVLETAIKLSVAGASDLRTATKSLVQIANAYEISFNRVESIANLAFQTVKYGQLTLEQYTEQMSKVVSTASLFDVSIEELSAAIATMTINGINADQAFTSLNQMLMAIANPTKQARDLMQQLGLQLTIGDIKEKGLGFALEELIPIMDGATTSGRQLLTILFKNRTGFKAAASLVQNIDDYNKNHINMLNSSDAMADGLAERMKDVQFQISQMKRMWDEFLMSFISGDNKNVALDVIDKIKKAIELLNKNISIAISLVVLLATQIAVRLAMQLAKLGVSLFYIKSAITKLRAEMALAGAQAEVLWAKVTSGISLIISAIIQVVFWMAQFAKKAKEAELENRYMFEKSANQIKALTSTINELEQEMNKIAAVEKMINRFEKLNSIQSKTAKQNGELIKIFGAIASNVKQFGIELGEATVQTVNMNDVLSQLKNRSDAIRQQIILTNILQAGIEMTQGAGMMVKGMAGSPARVPSPPIRAGSTDKEISETMIAQKEAIEKAEEKNKKTYIHQLRQVSIKAQLYQQQFSELYSTNNLDSASSVINEALKWASDNLHKYGSIIATDDKSATNIREIVSFLSETTERLRGLQSLLLSQEELKWKGLEISDDGGKPTERSYLDRLESMFSEAIGTNIYPTLDEFREARMKALDDVESQIRKDMADPKIVVKDAQEALSKLGLLREMTDKDTIMQLFDAGEKAISFYTELGKNLLESGDLEGGRAAMLKAKSAYDSYSARGDGMSDEALLNAGFTDSELRTLRENMQNGGAKFLLSWFNAASSFLSDKEYLDAVVDTFGIDESVTESIKSLDDAIKQAEADGQSEKSNALKKIREMVAKSVVDSLSEIISLKENSEFYPEIEKRLKQVIDEEGGVEAFDAALLEMTERLKAKGIVLSDKDIDDIGKLREGLTGDSGFNVKQLLGIKEYKDESAAIFDVAQQAVNQLSQVWSFYWQWEQQQLQKQTEKKLAILKREKDIMLANVNMSEEQKALINEKYAERERILQEEQAKKLAAMKKKQAIYDAMVDFAKGLIGIHTVEYGTKGIFGIPTAALLTGLLTGVFSAQMAMINNQKFAGGGYTGSGYGSPDETGHKPAGIVHAGELVIDKETLDRNFNPIMSMYEHMKSGGNMGGFLSKYLLGGMPRNSLQTANGRLFAQGGYVGKPSSFGSIQINLGGARVLDPIELNRIVEIGGKKRRRLNA